MKRSKARQTTARMSTKQSSPDREQLLGSIVVMLSMMVVDDLVKVGRFVFELRSENAILYLGNEYLTDGKTAKP